MGPCSSLACRRRSARACHDDPTSRTLADDRIQPAPHRRSTGNRRRNRRADASRPPRGGMLRGGSVAVFRTRARTHAPRDGGDAGRGVIANATGRGGPKREPMRYDSARGRNHEFDGAGSSSAARRKRPSVPRCERYETRTGASRHTEAVVGGSRIARVGSSVSRTWIGDDRQGTRVAGRRPDRRRIGRPL